MALPLDFNQLNSAYQNTLGRNIGTEGANFYMNSGKTMQQIQDDLAFSQEGQQYLGNQQQRYVAPQNQIQGLTYASNRPPPTTGLMGAESALQQGLGGNIDALVAGGGQARQDLQTGLGQANQSYNQGVAGLNPFSQGGQQAQQTQLAQSGALGPEAQAQAYQNFQESPGQSWLREQGDRGVTRNAARLGGLGGANVMKELSRFNQGLASQDFGNQFNRLGTLSNQGLTAAGNIGNLRANQAGTQFAAGQGMGNVAQATGQNIGSAIMNTGTNIATGRTNAGNQIAGNVQSTSIGLADLLNNQGGTLADLIGQGGQGMQNLIIAAQGGDADAMQQMATLLANINLGTGGQVGGVNQTAYDPTSTYQGIASGLTDLVGAFGSGGQQQQPGYSNYGGNTQSPDIYGGYA